MNVSVKIADVIDAFRQRGFEYVGKTETGLFKLHGQLTPTDTNKGCTCEVQLDPAFLNSPVIRLLEIPPELPPAVPHLGVNGELCYLAKGTVVLDIHDPVGQSLKCLQLAEEVFGQIMRGEMVDDLAEEFFAYWKGGRCFLDVEGGSLGQQHCLDAHSFRFITDDINRTTQKLISFGIQVVDELILTYRIETDAQPRPLTKARHWPPKTVRDILEWQSALDPQCRRKIHQRIKEAEQKKVNKVLIIIESPRMPYGFEVSFDHQFPKKKIKLSDRRDLSYGYKVTPIEVTQIDDHYLAQRNMPQSKTLEGKNLVVVGCGTIGGYLADMLVKAGAGTCGGKLTLVDFDVLLPQNIGRHRLGFPSLLRNKANEMARELMRLAPSAEIRALTVDVMQAQLGELDLLIDATGEEALGHWLCGRYPRPLDMLTVWIEGPGMAVRALLRSSKLGGACFRCLWHGNRRGELRSTIDPIPTILAGHGCEGLYVPFPASVSVHAASLGAEMALDWVNGVHSPALRTRLIDRTQQLATPDCDPKVDAECPMCNS